MALKCRMLQHVLVLFSLSSAVLRVIGWQLDIEGMLSGMASHYCSDMLTSSITHPACSHKVCWHEQL